MVKPALETWMLYRLARSAGAKLVFTAHNVVPHDTQLDPAHQRAMGAFMARCHRVIVHTHESRRWLLELWPELAAESVCVIPHGNYSDFSGGVTREAARRRFGLPADELIVGFIGKIRPYKGLLELIDALRTLNPGFRPHLFVAGRPDDPCYFEQVRDALAAIPAEHATMLARYLSDDELESCFAAVDIVALPYTRIDQSGILMYAMTTGACVVASSLPGFHSVLGEGDGALYFEAGNVEALRRVLARALQDDELRRSQGRRAKEAAESFSWNRIAELTSAAYDA
jgi:glycosyltransferase involved in cell wall biosynthesis